MTYGSYRRVAMTKPLPAFRCSLLRADPKLRPG